jgi:hypothetical protein
MVVGNSSSQMVDWRYEEEAKAFVASEDDFTVNET